MTKQLSKIALAAIVALACFGIRAQESSRQAPAKKSTIEQRSFSPCRKAPSFRRLCGVSGRPATTASGEFLDTAHT
jgi:hypothetical protein